MFPIQRVLSAGRPHSTPIIRDTQPSREPISIDAVIAANSTGVYNICLRFLRDADAAEDACQETMIAAWRHREDGVGRAWLMHVAVNKCRDELRRRARRPSVTLDFEAHDADYASACVPTPEAIVMHA